MQLKKWLEETARWIVLWALKLTGQFPSRVRRIDVLAIGFSGYVSDVDKAVAKQENLKPPTGLDLWLARDYIAFEQERRRSAWQEVVFQVTGETI